MGMVSLDDIVNTGQTLKEKGYKRVSPHFVPKILANMASGLISVKFGFKVSYITGIIITIIIDLIIIIIMLLFSTNKVLPSFLFKYNHTVLLISHKPKQKWHKTMNTFWY